MYRCLWKAGYDEAGALLHPLPSVEDGWLPGWLLRSCCVDGVDGDEDFVVLIYLFSTMIS